MNLQQTMQSASARWAKLPAVLRWNGSTLLLAALVACGIRSFASGPAKTHAELTPPPRMHLAQTPPIRLRIDHRPTTQPAPRNLFSLAWTHAPTTKPAANQAAPDDPKFWSAVAQPLKPRPTGSKR